MKRVLVLFAHPSPKRSEVNIPLMQATKAEDNVTVVDLYAEYPTFQIDIDKEQQRLLEHDVIVFMFPLYWYSTPSILKEWQDLVLEYGFAYGSEGQALKGKTFVCALTAGASESGYHAAGYNNFTIRELLQPLEQTALLTHMQYLPPYALFGARTAVEEQRVDVHIEQWLTVLTQLKNEQLNIEQAQHAPSLNHFLAQH